MMTTPHSSTKALYKVEIIKLAKNPDLVGSEFLCIPLVNPRCREDVDRLLHKGYVVRLVPIRSRHG